MSAPLVRSVAVVTCALSLTACAAPSAPRPEPTPLLPSPTAVRVAPTPTATRAPTPRAAATPASAPLVELSVGNLARTLHPYPDASSYTPAWLDAAALIWGGAEGGGGLVAFDWNTLDYRPAMATQLPRVSNSGKTFTFTLRNDVKWSDGFPVTVDDFVYAYDQASRDDSGYVQLDVLQELAAYRALDQQTIEVTLKDAAPRELALAIINVVMPVPKHVWNGLSWTDAASNPEIMRPSVVLGPFAVQEFRPGDRAVFTPVTTYYVGTPRVPRVEIVANSQPNAAYELLKNGQVNWIRALPPTQYQAASANPDVTVKEWTPANATFRAMEFNLARPFVGDRRVREALARSLDRAELIRTAEQGHGVAQYSFVQPTNVRWVNGSVEKYEFDLDRARRLLVDAGYDMRGGKLVGKDGTALRLQVVYPTTSAPRQAIAGYLRQQYAQLGIDVDARGLDFNAYTDQVENRRDFDVALASYGGGSLDPEFGPRAQLTSTGQQNVTGYANPQVDEVFKQASVELDPSRRKALYDQAQMLVNADLPVHYLYALNAIDAFSRHVQGVSVTKGDRLDYNGALLSWTVDQ